MSPLPRVVVAGGSGLLGTRLAAELAASGHEVVVLTRAATSGTERSGVRRVRWDGRELGAWASELDGAAAVVNLAGENVGAGRWSAARMRRLRSSRVEPARAIVEAIGRARSRPAVLLQASAVGYYGDRGAEPLADDAERGRGFLPELCRDWEAASAEAESLGLRRVLLRTGIVLSRQGGALAKMLPAFRWGVAGPLGSGRQWLPWIHEADAIAALRFLLARPALAGAVNVTAPEPVTNAEFTRELARACRRPAFLRVPPFALRLLFGEMAGVLLGGQRALPRRLVEAGFEFRFPGVAAALDDLLGRR